MKGLNEFVFLLFGAFVIFAFVSTSLEHPDGIAVGLFVFGVPGAIGIYLGRGALRRVLNYVDADTRYKRSLRFEADQAKREAHQSELRAREHAERDLALETESIRLVALRDADTQLEPYAYRCVGHPNNTLALRYGIANREYTIRLKKTGKIRQDEAGAEYFATLPDFGKRQVRVVIRPGTDIILTFLPIKDSWFKEHEELESLLKDNPTFTLKELATFHVQAVLNAKH